MKLLNVEWTVYSENGIEFNEQTQFPTDKEIFFLDHASKLFNKFNSELSDKYAVNLQLIRDKIDQQKEKAALRVPKLYNRSDGRKYLDERD